MKPPHPLYPSLFEPCTVAGLHLPNRIVLPPMVIWKAPEDGSVTREVLDHYARFEGVGLVVVEATVVSPEGRLSRDQLGAFDDHHVDGLRRLAELIHAGGASAAIQIHHAGRNTTLHNTFGLPLVAPSPVAERPDGDVPVGLREEDIERIMSCFAAAAARVTEAGFDAVEVHAAHGYLVSQFLSPLANLRTDRWGGSLENRARFLREVMARCRAETTGRSRIYCRLGVADGDPGGLTLEEGIQVASWLEQDGVPLLHVSSGIGKPPRIAPEGSPYSDRMHLGLAVKRAVGVPVIGVGDIRHPAEAESLLKEGLVDLVAVGRGQLADPGWARKSAHGKESTISTCRDCKVCNHFRHAERCPARRALAGAA